MDRNPMIPCCLHQPEKFSQNFPQGASDSEGGGNLRDEQMGQEGKEGW